MTQSNEDAAPSDAVDAQIDETAELEATLESEATQDVTPEPDPEKVAAAEAELAARRVAQAQQAMAAAWLAVQPVQVIGVRPVAIEGQAETSIMDITVRVDTRSYEWQRTFAQRVVRPQK